MSLDKQVQAVRYSVALSKLDHVVGLRLAGKSGFEVLDRLVPADLFIRDGQMLHTLLLAEDARPLADLYLCCDDEDFILFAEGMTADELKQHIRDCAFDASDLEIEVLNDSCGILSLNGPFAWELLAELVGPEIIGMPYLSLGYADKIACFRAGKTGEYGFDLLVPSSDKDEFWARAIEKGKRFDLEIAGLEALDLCALEGWFFNIRREGRMDVTPIELQLQWRVSYKKEYVGSTALANRRQRGPQSRLVFLVSGGPLEISDAVAYDDQTIGRVVNAGYSPVRKDYVGLALIEPAWAYPGIGYYSVVHGSQNTPVRTVTPPVLNNRSLHVSPQVHSYFTRDEFDFPQLTRRTVECVSRTER